MHLWTIDVTICPYGLSGYPRLPLGIPLAYTFLPDSSCHSYAGMSRACSCAAYFWFSLSNHHCLYSVWRTIRLST